MSSGYKSVCVSLCDSVYTVLLLNHSLHLCTVSILLVFAEYCQMCQSALSLKVPPAVPLAYLVGDSFGKLRPVGRCGGGSVTAGTTGCGWVGSCRFWSIIT